MGIQQYAGFIQNLSNHRFDFDIIKVRTIEKLAGLFKLRFGYVKFPGFPEDIDGFLDCSAITLIQIEQQTLKIAANKHDVTGIRVYDKREESIPNLGMVQMQDEETGELLLVNTTSKKVRMNYGKFYQEKVNYYKDSFTKSGAGVIDCRTDESYVKKLLGYFKRRG